MKISSLLRGGLALLLCTLTLPSVAQFNGPGIVSGADINKPTTITTDRALLYPATHDQQLGTGDLLTIHIFGQADYTPIVRIGTDGKVMLPLIGVVSLDGLTVTTAEELIARRLEDAGMFENPQVTIQVTEGPNAVITVIGEAHGTIPVQGSRRLFDVLSAAGGLPPTANHVITINRPGLYEPLVVDLGTDPAHSSLANIPVFAGDTIVISRVGVVYMIGAFKTPNSIPLVQNTPLTLLEAASLSGGPAFEAKYNDLRLIRTVGNERTVVKLDMKKVLYGQAADPILQPNDIVFLPNSTLKSSIGNGSLGTLLGVVGLVISIAYR
jgi:polysaccharide export outer membrane protein